MPVTFGTVPNEFQDPARDIVESTDDPQSNMFMKLLDLLGRPSSTVAGFARGLIGDGDIGKAWKFAKQGFLGDAHYKWSDTLRKLGMPVGSTGIRLPLIGTLTGRGALGFALDVATDPLTYINFLSLGKAAKLLPKGLETSEREVLGGLKQNFNKLYDGLLHSALSADDAKVEEFFKRGLKYSKSSDLPATILDPFEQTALPTVKINPLEAGAAPVESTVKNTPLEELLKTERGQKIRAKFDEMVLPQLKENYKAMHLAGIEGAGMDTFTDAARILDKVTDTNMGPLQMFRNIAASDMGFLGGKLTDQARKGYRSLINFAGYSMADLAEKLGIPAPAISKLRGADALVFKGIDSVLGGFKNKFPKITDQLYRAFHAGTGIPEVDETLSKFGAEESSKMRDALAAGIKITREQNKYIKSLNPEQTRQFYRDVMDQMEWMNPNNTLADNVIDKRKFMKGSTELAIELRRLSDETFRNKATIAERLNMPAPEYLPGYFPRELTPAMKELIDRVMEDAPIRVSTGVPKGRTQPFASMTTGQINDRFMRDRLAFEHFAEGMKNPKWKDRIAELTKEDPELMSYFVDNPAEAIANAHINSTRAASRAELTRSLLQQFGRPAFNIDKPREIGEHFMYPNIYNVTNSADYTPEAMRNLIRETLDLPKEFKNEQVDLIGKALKNFNANDRIEAAVNPDKFMDSQGGNLAGQLLAKLPGRDIHAMALLHGVKAPLYIMDDVIHRHLENMWSKIRDPATYSEMLKFYDNATNFWKRSVTVGFPSFHFRNMLQDLWQMYLGGFNPLKEMGPNGAYIHAIEMMKDSNITGRLRDLPEEFVGKAGKRILLDGGGSISQAQMWRDFIKDGGLVGVLRDIPISGNTGVDSINEALRKKFFQGKNLNPLSKDFLPIAAGGKTSEVMTVGNRLANYISLRKQGMSGFDAMMNTRKVLFDYADLSTYEKRYLKRVFPFYAWSRKNIPFQLKAMIQQPGKFGNLMKAVNLLDNPDARKNIPAGGIPDYINKEFGITTQQNPDGTYRFLMMGGFIPPADLVKIGSPEEMSRLALKSLNPIPQALLESSVNKNFFSNFPVRQFPGEKKVFLGRPMNADAINLLRKFTPINSSDKYFFREDPNNPYQKKLLSPTEKVFSSLTGVNVRDIDTEKLAESKQKQIAVLASKLRANYNRSLDKGDTKMQHYFEDLLDNLQASQYK